MNWTPYCVLCGMFALLVTRSTAGSGGPPLFQKPRRGRPKVYVQPLGDAALECSALRCSARLRDPGFVDHFGGWEGTRFVMAPAPQCNGADAELCAKPGPGNEIGLSPIARRVLLISRSSSHIQIALAVSNQIMQCLEHS